jgi:hypothetical protein
MRDSLKQTVAPLWQTYSSPGQPLRETTARAMRVIYGLWFVAFALKLMGSGWDIAWHFRFLRDDMAPPHLINTVGTMLVVGLVMFHTWTGYAVDRLSLRLMQAGIGTFLLAIPLDLLNHRIFGLDITAWSPTHAMLYLGTAVMLLGVLRGWTLLVPESRLQTGLAVGFWAFLLEDMLFPLGQQEYGVRAVAALHSGQPTADAELLAKAGANPEILAVPVPAWVYPIWHIAAAVLVLLAVRMVLGKRWAATSVTLAYLAYRVVSYGMLVSIGFPDSYIPFILLGTALAIDVTESFQWRPIFGTLGLIGGVYGIAVLTERLGILMPPFPVGTAALAALVTWSFWAGARWVFASPVIERWRKLA